MTDSDTYDHRYDNGLEPHLAGRWHLHRRLTVLADLPDPASYVVYRSPWPDDSPSDVHLLVDRQRVSLGQTRLPLDVDASVVVTGKRIELEGGGVNVRAAGTVHRIWPKHEALVTAPWRMRGSPRKDAIAVPIGFFPRPRWVRLQVDSIFPDDADTAVRFFVDGDVVQSQNGDEAAFFAGSSVDVHGQEFVVDFWPKGDDAQFDVRGYLRFER